MSAGPTLYRLLWCISLTSTYSRVCCDVSQTCLSGMYIRLNAITTSNGMLKSGLGLGNINLMSWWMILWVLKRGGRCVRCNSRIKGCDGFHPSVGGGLSAWSSTSSSLSWGGDNSGSGWYWSRLNNSGSVNGGSRFSCLILLFPRSPTFVFSLSSPAMILFYACSSWQNFCYTY